MFIALLYDVLILRSIRYFSYAFCLLCGKAVNKKQVLRKEGKGRKRYQSIARLVFAERSSHHALLRVSHLMREARKSSVCMGGVSKDELYERSVSKDSSEDCRSVGSKHQKAIPHYLRASASGSCHDFCKFGRQHSFESEARKPYHKRVLKPYLPPVRIGGKEKEEAVKKAPITCLPNTKSYPAKPKASSDNEKANNHKLSTFTSNHSPDIPSSHHKSIQSSSNTKIHSSRQSSKTLWPKFKHSSPTKLTPIKVKPSSSYDDSDGMFGKRRELMPPKTSANKKLASPSANLTYKLSLKETAQSKSGNLKLVSSLKDRSRIRKVSNEASKTEKASEKTLHAISSHPSPSASAKPSASEKSSSSSHEVGGLLSDKEAHGKENHKRTTRKSRFAANEDKHASPVKVKFRMGKVVEIQSDNNTPRRLRFRRARVVGVEQSKDNFRKKISKKAGVSNYTASNGDSSQKVVLKHQDGQGKKDVQGLLNNVIEETASKLAVSRKGKVKALVGAFETVISLQEIKPSTQMVS